MGYNFEMVKVQKRSKKKNIIAGNWKMNPNTREEAKEIFLTIRKKANKIEIFSNVKTIVCPPFVYISELSKLTAGPAGRKISIGAQDVFFKDTGPFTGEISASMLKDLGVEYVIIGHSERRALGETNELVFKKIVGAIKMNLQVIVCVGEKERDNHGDYMDFLKNQIKECFGALEKKDLAKVIVAYEPLWAIGRTDKQAMQPTQIHETVIFIRKNLSDLFDAEIANNVPILYGGSVTLENASSILKHGHVNGLLVGGESLHGQNFGEILKIASEV
jgi:triosephosphate isomerase